MGLAGKNCPDWQQDSMAKYGGGRLQKISAYPVLICEEDSINEAAALLIPAGAKEIIWADAGAL
jgi:hypothetical protein